MASRVWDPEYHLRGSGSLIAGLFSPLVTLLSVSSMDETPEVTSPVVSGWENPLQAGKSSVWHFYYKVGDKAQP